MKGFATDAVHVLLRAGQRPLSPPPGVVVHRTRTLTDGDIYRAVRPPCTTIARSVVDAASWASSADEARTVIAMVFQQRMTTLAEIAAVVDRMHARSAGNWCCGRASTRQGARIRWVS